MVKIITEQSILKATPDNQILLRDGTWKQVSDLKRGDELADGKILKITTDGDRA